MKIVIGAVLQAFTARYNAFEAVGEMDVDLNVRRADSMSHGGEGVLGNVSPSKLVLAA